MLEPGVYLGYLFTLSTLKGLYVMVPDNSLRNMIPNVFISPTISPQDWRWIQSIHLRAERSMPLVGMHASMISSLMYSYRQ